MMFWFGFVWGVVTGLLCGVFLGILIISLFSANNEREYRTEVDVCDGKEFYVNARKVK